MSAMGRLAPRDPVSRTAPARDAIVARWVDAFNDRDLEGMLARCHPEVRFHPLRLAGSMALTAATAASGGGS